MGKLNEFFRANNKTIAFIFMLCLLVIMIYFFNYFRQNVEYIKMNPCDYCMNKTKFTCIYYDNSIYGDSRKEINLSLENIKQLRQGNQSVFSSVNS